MNELAVQLTLSMKQFIRLKDAMCANHPSNPIHLPMPFFLVIRKAQ